jgi:L-asparaginase
MNSSPAVRVICCGGTIDKVYFDAKSDFQVGEPQASNVLHESNVTLNYSVRSLIQKDSIDLTVEDRQLIHDAVALSSEDRILITHGTSTMIETAKALEDIAGKTIVLTGAMSPARFRNTDALFNVGFAFGVVQTLRPGVYIAMHGRVLDPNRIKKNDEQERFEDLV